MPVHNGESFLEAAVYSILRQDFSDFEFLIIDDGSTDGTASILNSICDDRIRLIHQNNRGLIKSLNRGLHLARGNYIARMDADDISHSSRLRLQVALLEENTHMVLVASHYKVITTETRVASNEWLPLDPVRRCWILQFRNVFAHGSVMVRKDAILQNGGYHDPFIRAEDYDLWTRICTPKNTGVIPRFLYFWRMREDSNPLNSRLISVEARNTRIIRERNVARCCPGLPPEIVEQMYRIYQEPRRMRFDTELQQALFRLVKGFCKEYGIDETGEQRLWTEVLTDMIDLLCISKGVPWLRRLKNLSILRRHLAQTTGTSKAFFTSLAARRIASFVLPFARERIRCAVRAAADLNTA
jgi:glycosyltransferase involved in cell wall biosynthesis